MKRGLTLAENQFIKLSREALYNEVWEISVIGVAKKYNVPYAGMLKLCKESQIPIPPSGYWTKLNFGKQVSKTPLPESLISEVVLPIDTKYKLSDNSFAESTINVNDNNKKLKKESNVLVNILQDYDTMNADKNAELNRVRNFSENKVILTSTQSLNFLTESEHQKVLLAAQKIQMPTQNVHLYKKIIAYKSVIKEWDKNDTKAEGAQRSYKNFSKRPPFLAGVISKEALQRAFRILDSLFRCIEELGGSVNDDLSLNIRNEIVHIEIIEGQDEIKHKITKEEAKELLIYEDAVRYNRWGSKPNIRKYDYVFNGRLRITIRKNKHFRDTDSVNVESMLGEMLIELYEESEVVRINRLAREEEQRRQEEEKRLREERRILYNEEAEKTIELVNAAQDYDIACKIRAYILALELSDNKDNTTIDLIDWAKKKADWFDPTVARKDEFLGKREHNKSEEYKTLKKSYYW